MRYAHAMGEEVEQEIAAGLCSDCVHARRVASERGSVFVMCQLSLTDARFPKYPRLPVLSCSGYLRKAPDGGDMVS